MIKTIIEFSAKNRFLILGITSVLIVFSYFAIRNIPLEAIPDMSDTQVIVYSKWDRSPDIMEDQVTYPIITSLLGAPKVKAIRGFSDFGYSFVYVVFQDGTDLYWARSRVSEYLSQIQTNLPSGVKTSLGPDATGVGWIFQYTLADRKGKHTLADLRTYQDFKLKYLLTSIPGVAEVATIGGFKKQYQIQVDPNKLIAYNIDLGTVIDRVKESNNEIGARLLEINGTEFMIRAKGYVASKEDLENISISADSKGTSVFLGNIATVTLGPDLRRGVGDWNGEGDSVSGIVVMRDGENALDVIQKVKEKLISVKDSLPEGVEVVPTYDRSELILSTIQTLKEKLTEEVLVVSLIILIFLWHIPSAIIPILTIPIAILLSFIPLFLFDIGSNLMSLSGIAISIGVLVDGAIVEVENAYKKLEEWETNGRVGDFHQVRLEALLEVGPSVFFSLLIIAVAFFPIFTLVDQEGRLFRPLAISKNLTMMIAAILAITLDPAFRMLFTRMDPFTSFTPRLNSILTTVFVGKYHKEENHPISRRLFSFYTPIVYKILDYPKTVIGSAVLIVIFSLPVYFSLGKEFMPPLYEGSLLYMPTTLPGISVNEAERILNLMDKKLKSFPEVASVYGKAGRADTSTDPSPLSMFEITILLQPESKWRKKEIDCDQALFPTICRAWHKSYKTLAFLFSSKTINKDELIFLMNRELQFPGFTNAWTEPIRTRIDMLATGIRTPVGIKVQGNNLKEIESASLHIEAALKDAKGVRSVFAERSASGYYLDIDLERRSLARYGLTIEKAQKSILSALGGEAVSQTIEGRERYSIQIRYPRDSRDSLEKIKTILLPKENQGHIPIGSIADVKYSTGPSMIRDENGFLTGYVYIDTSESDIEGFVENLKLVVGQVPLPKSIHLEWSGQYENILRVRERMKLVLPITLILIFFLLYLNTKSYAKTLIILLAVPFSLVGAVWILWILNYQISIATWVGFIALLGLDAETGVFMLLYLDLAYESAKKEGKMIGLSQLKEAVHHGAVKRIRPKMMTVLSAFFGLIPILWATGSGSDMMKRIAAPMVGGLATSFLLELIVYPAVFYLWKKREFQEKVE
ncbi:efflux RND transporter permease subunit [Leptospira sp. 'Mane']|uniref:efflux RND transporter permease subunit n=1 Tax=Leptospira sp. 'Mane' TaxID=3387407 RepID=UPI00398A9F8F